MKVLVLCLIALTVINASNLYEQYPLNFKKARSFMALLTQVEAKLKAGGPLDQITKMLNEFKNEITDEQVTHDNLWEKQQKECNGETEFRQKEIADAKGALQAATETLDGCTQQQARAKADLGLTKTQLSENLDYLVIIDSVYQQTTYQYETQKTAYELIRKALEEGVVMVQEWMTGEQSFAQVVKHTNGVLKMLTKVNKVKLIQPVLGAMIQMQKLDPEDEQTFKRVVKLLTDLLDKVNEAFQKTYDDYNTFVAEYQENQARTKAVIANLEENKNGLEAEIAALDKCIVTQSGITQSAQAKIDRNQQLLDDADDLCAAVQVQYEEATKQRKQELKLLNALRERVEARFGQISEGVTARGVQDEFSYENQSDYEHKSFN